MRKLLSGLTYALLVIAAAGLLHAQVPGAAAPALQSFSSPQGRFSILFPGTPIQDTQTVNLKNGGTTILYQASVELESGNVAYMVIYNDYPGTYGTGDPQTVLAGTRDGAVSGKTLLTDAPISLNGVPGRAFTAKDDTWNYTVRQYLKGQRLYQLIIVYNNAHPATVTDQFVNSFAIW
jgi:hypothetical protein